MLTPVFELSQDDSHLIVSIEAPYAKVSDIDVHFENTNFMFFSKPYYLRLNLPGEVSWVEEPSVTYDSEKKQFRVYVPKKNRELFKNLNSSSCLHIPTKSHFLPTLDTAQNGSEEDESDLSTILKVPEEKFECSHSKDPGCGFANGYSLAIFNLEEEVSEIFDVKELPKKSISICRKERLDEENMHFDEEHYLADKYNDEEIQQRLKYKPDWDEFENFQDNTLIPEVNLTSKEKAALENFDKKNYSLDPNQSQKVILSLLDILFAYAYSKRTTEGENTVESAWTINKLSATLSWLEEYSTVESVAIACIRRSLIYPLYRHFELALTVLEDVRKILLLGKTYITKCLLEIHELFAESDPRYILNDLFINDYISWLSSNSFSEDFIPVAKKLNNTLLTKGEVGLDLVDIETLALVAWNNRDILQGPDPEEQQPAKEGGSSGEAALCASLHRLSVGGCSSSSRPDGSEYEGCRSCTSGSSSSSSDDDSFDCSSDSSSEGDDDDDELDSDDSLGDGDEYSQLLRGASAGERTH